jgi:integrase
MASITNSNGLKTIQFTDGKVRKSIRLGRVSKKYALEVKAKVEALLSAKVGNFAIDRETAEWVSGIGQELADRLAKAGLISPRKSHDVRTLQQLIDRVAQLKEGSKKRTIINLKQAGTKLTNFFGHDKEVARITPSEIDDFLADLRKTLAPAYVARLTKYGKQFMHEAKRLGLIRKSPFEGIKAGSMSNPNRNYFLSLEDTDKILQACPNAEWRLIVSLARFGGLRCPSEIAALTWPDIDWEKDKFLVKAPKTGHRWVPLFAEIRPHLQEVFEQAEPGALYVLHRTRAHETNLRTQMEQIIYRAGLLPWPKLFQNMRSTRETELAQAYPLHVVTAWIGNSARVAMQHYLQITDADFKKAAGGAVSGAEAVQNPVQSGEALEGQEGNSESQNSIKDVIFPSSLKMSSTVKGENYARQESNL